MGLGMGLVIVLLLLRKLGFPYYVRCYSTQNPSFSYCVRSYHVRLYCFRNEKWLTRNRVLICIPIGGELLPTIGGSAFICFFGGILGLSLVSFLLARWACLEYRWKWNVKI
jgi:hypothetical protein